GTNWHSQTTGPQPSVRCVTSSPERIISLGEDRQGQLAGMWSSNGIAWNPIEFDKSHRMWSMIYDQGKFIAIGPDGYITLSTNRGDTWMWPERATTLDLFDIIPSPLGYVASGAGTIIQSDDGLNWRETAKIPGYARQIAYGDGKFIIAIERDLLFELWVSSDLVQWTKLIPEWQRAFFF